MPQQKYNSLAAELRAITNKSTVKAVTHGFAAIDHHGRGAKKKLEQMGIEGADELVDKAADFLKRKSIELLTGKKPLGHGYTPETGWTKQGMEGNR